MYYVYILMSEKDNKKYIGYTENLDRRISEHNMGLVTSTKDRRPLKLFAHRMFINKYDAINWEKKYKNSHGQLNRDVKNKKMILNQ